MKNINWKMVIMVVFVAVSTLIGIHYMEVSFCEWMSGAMWMFGEITIVSIVYLKDVCNVIEKLYKEIADM